MSWKINEKFYLNRLERTLLSREVGTLIRSTGILFEAYLPGASIGSICKIFSKELLSDDKDSVDAEVVSFNGKNVFLMPFDDSSGLSHGSSVLLKKKKSTVIVGDFLLGRVLDGKGDPLDGKGALLKEKKNLFEERTLYSVPTHPLNREMIEEPFDLGIKAINGFLTLAKGQRVGIMAGSGVGKSVLLGMMARHTTADVNVIALIGERGREIKEFIENDLSKEALKKTVIIASTSDKSPLLRMRGAFLAATIAEYFRDQGKNVLFLMDSITRFCMAQREIGLAVGELPASRGYTPSVFSVLPKILERAGTGEKKGSITGVYSVLVEGDDIDEPISDAVRSIVDGHIILNREIAYKNRFPAIDVLKSISRVMGSVVEKKHLEYAKKIRSWMSIYQEAEDLIQIGAYIKGTNKKIDQAIFVQEKVENFLSQKIDEKGSIEDVISMMRSIVQHGDSF